MDQEDARRLLQDRELVVYAQGALTEMVRLREECLDAGIPVLFGACPGKS